MKSKRALIIRHVPYEGVAGFREPIEAAGYAIDRVDVSDPAFAALDLREPDLVIMMGGPMAVYEGDLFPWIGCQLRRLKLRLDADRPTLGVCFGAQMIASALGAKVYAGPLKELGFHRVRIHENALGTPLRHLIGVPILHWHGDTFSLPDSAELLASSHLYDHQAFRRGNNILALQFHAEMGEDERFYEWIKVWPQCVIDAGKTIVELSAHHDLYGKNAVAAGRAMVSDWLSQLNR